MKGRGRRHRRGLIATGIFVGAVAIGATAAHQALNDRVLHTIVLRGQAYGMAIDEPAHRAVVIGVTAGITGYASTIDTVTGHLVRTVTLGPNPTDLAVDERTGRVFITDILDGTVSVLDVRSGALLRTVPVGQMQPHDLQRIAIDPQTDHVFVSSSPLSTRNPALSAVHMLDGRSGAVEQTTKTGGGSLAVDDVSGQVFTANLADSSISVLDARTGVRTRTIALGAYTHALHIVADGRTGRVFVATDDDVLQIDDLHNWRLLRALPHPGVRNELLAVDEVRGRVVAVDYRLAPPFRAYVRLLDARTGVVVHTVLLTGVYPVVLDRHRGRVIVGTASGVRAFDVRAGAALWTFAGGVHTQGDIAVDERTGRVFVVDRGAMDAAGTLLGAGSVIVLDGRSGAQQSVTPVGVYAGPVAKDEWSGHAIVLNDGGTVRANDPWRWLPAWLRQRLPFVPQPLGTRTVSGSVSLLDATC